MPTLAKFDSFMSTSKNTFIYRRGYICPENGKRSAVRLFLNSAAIRATAQPLFSTCRAELKILLYFHHTALILRSAAYKLEVADLNRFGFAGRRIPISIFEKHAAIKNPSVLWRAMKKTLMRTIMDSTARVCSFGYDMIAARPGGRNVRVRRLDAQRRTRI